MYGPTPPDGVAVAVPFWQRAVAEALVFVIWMLIGSGWVKVTLKESVFPNESETWIL